MHTAKQLWIEMRGASWALRMAEGKPGVTVVALNCSLTSFEVKHSVATNRLCFFHSLNSVPCSLGTTEKGNSKEN